jgi:hypothetical protein
MMSDSASRRSARLLVVAQTLAADVDTAATVTRLEAVGIESMLMRGPAVARRLYASLDERPYVDVDLLVPAWCFAEAEARLAELGFTESPLEVAFGDGRPGHAHGWLSPDGRNLDLHWTLIGIGAPADEVWPALADETEVLELAETPVRVPSDPVLALILALHAGHHLGRIDHAARDLQLALERFPVPTWERAAALAHRLDAVGLFAGGLESEDAGAVLLRRLGVGASQAHRELGGDRAFHLANDLASLRATRGARAKTAFAGERLLPKPAAMRSRSRLARCGTVGLALAYGLRVLDGAARLPRALAGLRAARRLRRHGRTRP